MYRTALRIPRHLSRRPIPYLSSTTPTATTASPVRHASSSSPFGSAPSPPRLPKEEQEIFEQLQRQSTGAFSTPRSATPQVNQSPDSTSSSSSSSSDVRMRINQSPDSAAESAGAGANVELKIEGGGKIADGEEVHPNLRRGAPPEFEGDVNPRTGEVGGPKTEPLRWGERGDWSYNGRVTDF